MAFLCNHSQIKRVDDNFIVCLLCKEQIVNQRYIKPNKGISDFLFEQRQQIEPQQKIQTKQPKMINKYYVDHTGINKIIVNTVPKGDKYTVSINGNIKLLTGNEISKMVRDFELKTVDKY